jgi:hypothetical protein
LHSRVEVGRDDLSSAEPAGYRHPSEILEADDSAAKHVIDARRRQQAVLAIQAFFVG